MTKERKEGPELTIAEIFRKYKIPPLTFSIDGTIILSNNGEKDSLSLKQALKLFPTQLIENPLRLINLFEKVRVNSPRSDGRPRSKAEIGNIRRNYEKMRNRLTTAGPGEILASIALNAIPEGVKAKWTKEGLVGNTAKWQKPDREISNFWEWVNRQSVRGQVDPDDVLEILSMEEGPIAYSFFIVRDRIRNGNCPSDTPFFREVDPLIRDDSPIIPLLKKVAEEF